MNLKDTLENSNLLRIVLISWFLSSFFIVFLLGRIDWIVHDELYDYGLQFSYVWANPYWFSLRSVYVCMAIPSFLSAIMLGLDVWKKYGGNIRLFKNRTRQNNKQKISENSMIISCPSCRKAFGKPLVMLDFATGAPRLVNVCPYCNTKLGETTKEHSDIETRVLAPDEEVKVNNRSRKH